MNDTTTFDRLQASIAGAERVLDEGDLIAAILDANIFATVGDAYPTPDLLVSDAARAVRALAAGRSLGWHAGYKWFRKNPAIRIAALVFANQVVVWECNEKGELHHLLGVVMTCGTLHAANEEAIHAYSYS